MYVVLVYYVVFESCGVGYYFDVVRDDVVFYFGYY